MADVTITVVDGRAVVQPAGVPSDLLTQAQAAAALAAASAEAVSETFYWPDQTDYTGSFSIGGGLLNLDHGSGQQGQDNIAIGDSAGLNLTTGYNNILIGSDTGKSLTGVDTVTSYGAGLGNVGNVFVGPNIASAANGALDNTGVGVNVFMNLYQGMDNAALGINALQQIVDGSENAAFGHAALQYLVGSGDYATGNGHRNSAFGDMAGRFLNNGSTQKTGGKSCTYVGTRTTSLSNDTTNENVFGSGAKGFGSNSVSLGSPEVEQQRHQGLILVGTGAQEVTPAAPLHAYNLTTQGAGEDGVRVSRAGAPEVYGYLELLGGTTITVIGSVASGSKGEVWFRGANSADSSEIYPLKIDAAGQIYMEEVATSAAAPNVNIASDGKLTEATGARSDWTPTIAAGSGSLTTTSVQAAKWTRIAPKTVMAQLDFTIDNAGTGAGTLSATLPVNAARNANAVAYDQNGVAYSALIRTGNLNKVLILTFAGATAIATGRSFSITLVYEEA